MKKIKVNLKHHSYSIYIGSNLFDRKDVFSFLKKKDRVIVVSNTTISNIWKKFILDYLLKNGILADYFIFPDGEKHKNLDSVQLLLSYLLQKFYDRNTVLFAFGGGVIGDLTGFVASIYQRGLKFIQVPTTLLSQVDASIGGKTGVNHVFGKNMIGSFWQPHSVITDLNFLNTLPRKELISGLSEVIKYAISFDYVFFQWLEKNLNSILDLNYDTLLYCITKCCELKSNIVTLDERENSCRVLLNFGHTYGHAIESYFNYSKWLHGEAVSVGMIIASKISEKLGILKSCDFRRVVSILVNCGLPVKPPLSMSPESYFKYIERDKKNSFGTIRLILPVSIGQVKVFDNINRKIMISAIKECY